MTDLTITLDDEKAHRLREKTQAAGRSAEELLTQVANDLADADAPEPLPPEVLAEARRRAAKPLGRECDARTTLRNVAKQYGLDLEIATVKPIHA